MTFLCGYEMKADVRCKSVEFETICARWMIVFVVKGYHGERA